MKPVLTNRQRKIARRAGRHRKQDVKRKPSGRIAERHESETPEDRMATVLKQPHRAHAKAPDDPALGHPLGRLLAHGYIDRKQYEAGERYCVTLRRWYIMKGLGLPKSGSLSADMVSGGMDHSDPGADIDMGKLEYDLAQMEFALGEVAQYHGLGTARNILFRAATLGEFIHDSRFGDLRIGLNALVRLMERQARMVAY